jgi:hypothetical protein
MLTILCSTLIIALFAFFYGRQQAQLYWPFRELNYDQFGKEKREELSDRAHAYGLIICLILCIGLVMLEATHQLFDQVWWKIVFKPIFHFMGLLGTFSMVFDPAFAVAYGQKWYYIGDSARTDIEVKKFLGTHEGKLKFFICLFMISLAYTIIQLFF